MNKMLIRVVLFTLCVLSIALFGAMTPASPADYVYPDGSVRHWHYGGTLPSYEAPSTIIIRPPYPHCHVVRTTKHDDILDTNDWEEQEVCD